MADFDRDSMLEMFIYEMNQLIESLESTVLKAESGFTTGDINEIFRVMHTIKGSSAMMLFDDMSHTAHAIEDMFFYLREEQPKNVDSEKIADVVLESMDFIKGELAKVEAGLPVDGVADDIIEKIKVVLSEIKGETPENEITIDETEDEEEQTIIINKDEFSLNRNVNKNVYLTDVFLIENCEMKNIRAYTNAINIQNNFPNTKYIPENMLDEKSLEIIEKNGYQLNIPTEEDMRNVLENVIKTSYTDYVSFRKIGMGDPLDLLSNLNEYVIKLEFSDGYGKDNSNILELFSRIDSEFEYLICEKIVVEGTPRSDLKLNGYSNSSQDVIENLIAESYNVSFVNVLQIKQEEKAEPEIIQTDIQNVQTEMPKESQNIDNIENIDKSNSAPVPKNVPNQVISVGINKLDQLLNLMGELVIAEAMVTQNPELENLELESFYKDARQLHKIINDVQDIVMSMRMVPLSSVFFKMHRIVRDMSKQLNKDIELVVIGEETEVDKNIIEHISDPLMHMIRNSIDHGIEKTEEERLNAGKPAKGTVTLEAKNSGGDVLIIIKDDGQGLDDEKIMAKAKAQGMLKKPESEYTEKEIHQFIFQPGFSTNDTVTNYSGRGVGMDVVINNLLSVGGSVEVSSVIGQGSEFTMKIPLTLAIIEGMIISLGGAYYTIPIISIRQQFKAKKEMISIDPSGNEMITTSRGEILNLIRLSEFFGVESEVSDIEDGIIIGIENGNKTLCLHVDQLVGERQVVVKSMPKYIKEIRGISGCTLLGNGDISLIIDVAGFFK